MPLAFMVPPSAKSRIGSPLLTLVPRMKARSLLALFLLAASTRSWSAEALTEVQKAASEWIRLRVETKELETAWEQERPLVETMATAAKERAALAEEKRELARAKTSREREEIESIVAKNQAAAEDAQAVEKRLKSVSTRLVALRASLPPRLSDALEMSYRSLAAADLAPGERARLVLTVLNRCAQFNRLITTGEDVLTLEGEPTAKSLEVIYWGLSHGYAIDRTAHKAWWGSPDRGAWRWQAKPDAFAQVAQVIAVANDKADPEFVVVPAQVVKTVGGASPP